MNCHSTYSCCIDVLLILRIFGLIVVSILFLQSGLDKITDRKGNMDWLTGYFSKTPFKNMVGFLLTILTFQEVLAGILCLAGIFVYAILGNTLPAIIGLAIGLTAFTGLFLGQRLAKDYASAASLVPYMIFNALALYLFL